MYKAVIFDLDGTLLDTLDDLSKSMNTVLENFGFPSHHLDKYKYFVGDGLENLVLRVLPADRKSPKIIAECMAAMRSEYAQKWSVQTKPYDGIMELLKSLQEKQVIMAVLSNKPHDFTQLCVDHFFPPKIFAAVSGASRDIPKKPAPDGALAIAAILKIPPSEFCYLGDTDTDMKTASSAGMFPIGVAWGFRTPAELSQNGARHILKEPLQLLDIIA